MTSRPTLRTKAIRRTPPRPKTRPRHPPKPLTSSSSRPVSVALTGGIGAGKSVALESFARHGAATRSSDDIVHELLQDDEEVQRALADRFGPDVIAAGGVDRAAIARVVFKDRAELDWLEQLLHPRVIREQARWQHELASAPDPPPITVTEVPLLYETGGDERFDYVVVITAPPEVRTARRPVDDERERRLIPDDEKVRRADYSYVNNGTIEELDAFVADVMARLTA